MKTDTAFVRMRSGGHLRDSKMSKKTPRFIELKSVKNRHRQKVFAERKKKGRCTNCCLRIFIFLPQDFVMIFQSSIIILLFFFF